MARKLRDYIASLPKEEQDEIRAAAAGIVKESLTLQDLRKARRITQSRMAKNLGMTQDGVSRLERRSDVLLSTLRKAVASLGGELNLVVKFPDRPDVILGGFKDADERPRC